MRVVIAADSKEEFAYFQEAYEYSRERFKRAVSLYFKTDVGDDDELLDMLTINVKRAIWDFSKEVYVVSLPNEAGPFTIDVTDNYATKTWSTLFDHKSLLLPEYDFTINIDGYSKTCAEFCSDCGPELTEELQAIIGDLIETIETAMSDKLKEITLSFSK